MLTILLTAIKSTLSHLIPFLLRFWREILIVLMFWLWQSAKSDYGAILSEYDTFKTELQTQALKKQEMDKLKDELHTTQLSKQAKDYQANIEHLNLDREKLRKGLQNEINRTGSLLNDVRVYQKRSSDAGLPKDESPTILSTEERTDCNSTITQLVDAGKSCAVDYNALYDAWMAHCDIYGCTE